jgi:polysaccharide biosynthesis transport protein
MSASGWTEHRSWSWPIAKTVEESDRDPGKAPALHGHGRRWRPDFAPKEITGMTKKNPNFRSHHVIEGTVSRDLTVFKEQPGPSIEAWRPVAPAPAVAVSHYLWMLRRHWWKCLACVAACVIATAIITARITPIYESTATVDVDRQMPSGVIGQESARPGGNDADQFLATQVKLIQSDSVLRPVALRYKLAQADPGASSPVAHGPVLREDAPIVLSGLKVTRPPNTYLLAITYRSKDQQLAADVANGISHSYIDHIYNIRYRSSAILSTFMEKQLEEIKAKMEQSSGALAKFERELNIINPEEKTSILSARLVQLNAEYTNAQADRVRKETANRSVKGGTLEAAQVSSQGEALKKLSERLDEAQQKFAEVEAHFGTNHPEYKKAATQVSEVQSLLQKARANTALRVEVEYNQAGGREAMLKAAVAETKSEFDRLNAHSFEYQAFKREAEADRKLYEELMRKIKEAGINAGFQGSAIRIADAARPAFYSVYPNKILNLAMAFLLSSLGSILIVIISDVLNNSVGDPETVAHTMHTEVIGALPRSKEPHLRAIAQAKSDLKGLPPGKNWVDPKLNGYDAAIRTLRNTILLGNFDRRLRSVMITSPAPSEGKSTIAVNLAIAHAQQGRRTLLIDCDLRRPSIHVKTAASEGPNLVSVLHGDAEWRDVVVKHETVANLDMLLSKSPLPGDAELIGEVLSGILDEAGQCYDLIIVDSPPMLGFPEPLQMATLVDGVLMVAHAGHTSRKALGSALTSLTRLRVKVLGVVLNEVCAATTESYAYYDHYGKYYKYYQASA